jgi:ribonucleoside-diphosphate reductase alpha chain
MATSILDYIFRELAISYLDRNDLAHVEPADLMPDTVGKGIAESNLPESEPPAEPDRAAMAAMMQRVASVASNGFVRNRLTVLQGGGRRASGARAETAARVEPDMPLFSGTLAVAAAVEASAADPRLEQIREARMKGYEGDSCGECGNFTLVRNGTCLKCDTCGGTSGCS